MLSPLRVVAVVKVWLFYQITVNKIGCKLWWLLCICTVRSQIGATIKSSSFLHPSLPFELPLPEFTLNGSTGWMSYRSCCCTHKILNVSKSCCIIGKARFLIGAEENHKSHAMRLSEIFEKRDLLWGKGTVEWRIRNRGLCVDTWPGFCLRGRNWTKN